VKADRGSLARSRWRTVAWLLLLAGCTRAGGPPPIARSAACATCGMTVGSSRFACERQRAGRTRVYDSIECLLRDAESATSDATWLRDYDDGSLHAADSMWLVRGTFATPMGGGYAAFHSGASAAQLARETGGRAARWDDGALAETGRPR